tara:strand:- start:1977 stop:2924 length:948 start_codon:yes stop_codon:yes gene_type:complete
MKLATIGEILVEFVSHERNCALEKITEYSGPYPSGAPAIFLNQAARMGAVTEMIGGVGSDAFGRSVLGRLRQDGVGIHGVKISKGLCTGTAFVTYFDNGTRDFIFHLNGTAVDQFTVAPSLFEPADTLLHVSASSLGVAPIRQMILEQIKRVSEAGGSVSFDPNARPELLADPDAREAIFAVMEQSTYLLPSTSDLHILYPKLSEDQALEKLLAAHVKIVVLKRGAEGIRLVAQGQHFELKGHTVNEVDPTGAGDCFCGTFLSLIAQGFTLLEAARYANAAGAIAVTRRGPMEGNSSPKEIALFLKHSSPKIVQL